MEPRLRASPEQFSILVDFMERHGDLSRPQSGPQGRLKGDKLWHQLTDTLNSLGGGVKKSPDKWKKVWADWKTKSKKKYLKLRLQASHTGGGPSKRIVLTALEERVVAVIGVSSVVGQAGVQEQGFHPESSMDHPLDHAPYAFGIVVEDHCSQNIATPTPSTPALASLPQEEEGTQAPSPPVPPQAPPPPLPRAPPVQNSPIQAYSPRSPSTTPRRALFRARRNRTLTPFERAADLFSSIEERRLVHEEARDRHLHEREMESLRLEAERIDVARAHNNLLHQLSLLGQQLIDVITQQ